MLNVGDTYVNPAGVTGVITQKLDAQQCLGDIFTATFTVGPMTFSLPLTEQGLLDAGYELVVPPTPDMTGGSDAQLGSPDPATV